MDRFDEGPPIEGGVMIPGDDDEPEVEHDHEAEIEAAAIKAEAVEANVEILRDNLEKAGIALKIRDERIAQLNTQLAECLASRDRDSAREGA